ncbi:response regulator transcription factor [Adlercreutzia sp. ZJ138]|uniref:response regulator transcription factor n=1 Tax=Adlercreutzia sp. ZJ138 TaxID=2709405 RepID=UPI0013EBE4D5|nr:helix-turn-helix transcriptional regulator [Adlercreutzia sp. ZJ138]
MDRVSRQMRVTALLATVGLALFLAAVWTARNENALVSDYALYAARFAKVIACFVIAFAMRSHIPSVERMLGAGAVFIGVHLVAYTATVMLGPESPEYLMASILSGVFSGIGEACIILLFAHLLSTFVPQVSAVAIPMVYLINEVLYYSTLYLPTPLILIMRPVGKVLAILLLLWCVRRKRTVAAGEQEHPLQYGFSLHVPREPLLGFLSSSQEWMLILAGTTLFPFLFGFIAQVCSNAGTNSGLYDVVNELMAVGVLVLLVAYGLLRGRRLTFDEVLYFTVPLFATGCLLLPYFWDDQVPLAGLLVKCGYTVYQVMFWMLLARKCYEDIRHTYLYFGIFYGLFELATAAARLAASQLWRADMVDFATMTVVALFSLWLIALYGLLFFAISKMWGRKGLVAASGTDSGATESLEAALPDNEFVDEANHSNDAEKVHKEQGAAETVSDASPFAYRLDAFCISYDITPREREVLIEAMHGYSMENIGRKLYVSRETVKTHLRRIYNKVGVSGKQELITFIDRFKE